jgi:hypothetical protein
VANEDEILARLSLGEAQAILDNSNASPLGQLLVSLADDVIKDLKAALKARDINTSSLGLSQSIVPSNVNVNGSEVSVNISMDFYWKYVNYGVNGAGMTGNEKKPKTVNSGSPTHGKAPAATKSFKDSILEWIPKRGAMLPQQFQTYDQFTYAIMTNLKKYGQAPRPFFDDVINDALVQTLKTPIEKVMGRAIELKIVKPWQ